MFFAIAPHPQVKPLGQSIDHTDTHTVQTAGNLIGILIEFSARMKLGHDHFGCRNAFFLVNIGGNAAPVVAHRARTIAIQRHINAIRMTRQAFIDGVVHHFVNHVVQARTIPCVANIHAGAFANRLQSTQNFDGISPVFRRSFGFLDGGIVIAHGKLSPCWLGMMAASAT